MEIESHERGAPGPAPPDSHHPEPRQRHRHQQRDEHGPVAAIPSPQPGVTDWAPSAVTPLGPWVDGEDLYGG